MFKKLINKLNAIQIKAIVALSDKKGEMYVPTLVLVAGAVLLGFVLINIFNDLFTGTVKTGLTESFTSIFTNIKSIITNGSPSIPTA